MQVLRLGVSNLHCASCVANITKQLNSLTGVLKVDVSLVNTSAEVSIDETKISEEQVLHFLSEIGYPSHSITPIANLQITSYEDTLLTQLQKSKRQTILLAICAIPVLLLSMGTMHVSFDMTHMSMLTLFVLLQNVLTIPVMVLCYPLYISGLKGLKNRAATMDSLIALGTGTAYIYSVYSSILVLQGDVGAYHQLYFEAIGVILTLTRLGTYIETRAKWHALQGLHTLATLVPQTVFVEENGSRVERNINDIQEGSIIFVPSGMNIPIDGEIIESTCVVNESMLTGESTPVLKQKGDTVYAGTMVIEGNASIRTTTHSAHSYVNTLITMIQEAQASKAHIARFADTVSAYFVPILLGISVVAFCGWFIVTHDFALSIRILLSTLMIACPCAMGIATPISLALGINKGVQNEIIIKNAAALENTAHTTTVVMDKTGTLTEGTPAVVALLMMDPTYTTQRIASLIADVVTLVKHPVNTALQQWVKSSVEASNPSSNKQEIAYVYTVGKGIQANVTIDSTQYSILLGSERLLAEYGIDATHIASLKGTVYTASADSLPQDTVKDTIPATAFVEQQTERAASIIYCCINGTIVALFALVDAIRKEAKELIQQLHTIDIETVVLSGDKQATVTALAKQLGITNAYAELLPEDKARYIQKLQQEGKKVLMVGDGINDALALSTADTGIAMGHGVDITQESAAIVLLTNNIANVYKAIQLSKITLRNIKQNLFWAFIYNIVSIPVATGLLYIVGGPLLTPVIAGSAMIFSSISVLLNALRLRHIKL